MAEQWFELHVVVRTTPELLTKLRDAVDDSDLAEIVRWDLTPLDAEGRRWDGSAASMVASGGLCEPSAATHPVFDGLRRGLHLHEQ